GAEVVRAALSPCVAHRGPVGSDVLERRASGNAHQQAQQIVIIIEFETIPLQSYKEQAEYSLNDVLGVEPTGITAADPSASQRQQAVVVLVDKQPGRLLVAAAAAVDEFVRLNHDDWAQSVRRFTPAGVRSA